MNARSECVSKTSAAGRLCARTELETDEYISEQNRKGEERKRKRLIAATERTHTNVLAKQRWEDHVGDFVPKKGLKDSTIQQAKWKHLVSGLNKAFPKKQPGSKYGWMDQAEQAEI